MALRKKKTKTKKPASKPKPEETPAEAEAAPAEGPVPAEGASPELAVQATPPAETEAPAPEKPAATSLADVVAGLSKDEPTLPIEDGPALDAPPVEEPVKAKRPAYLVRSPLPNGYWAVGRHFKGGDFEIVYKDELDARGIRELEHDVPPKFLVVKPTEA